MYKFLCIYSGKFYSSSWLAYIFLLTNFPLIAEPVLNSIFSSLCTPDCSYLRFSELCSLALVVFLVTFLRVLNWKHCFRSSLISCILSYYTFFWNSFQLQFPVELMVSLFFYFTYLFLFLFLNKLLFFVSANWSNLSHFCFIF